MPEPKYCYYIEIPPFEMIIQKGSSDAVEKINQMIQENSLTVRKLPS